MYYYGRNQDSWHSGVKPALLSTGRVGVALSEDGFHWKRYRGTLPEGAILDPDEASSSSSSSFDCVHVGCGDVFFFEGEWWMFYFGGSAETIEFGARGAGAGKVLQGFRMLPGLIKSTDGFVYNRKHSPGSPLLKIGRKNEFDEVFIAWPRVIPPPCKEVEGQFLPMNKEHWLMTYSSIQLTLPPVSAIGAATSSDGLQWTKAGCVLARGAKGTWDDGGVGRRHVLFLDGQYVMFYEGVDGNGIHGIGLAFSRDGIQWKKDTVLGTEPGGPIFRARIGEEEAWDNGTVAAPHVVQLDDGSFRLYYVGSNALKTQSAIGVALSDGTNFRSWIRPILSLPS
ncbi:hypothetical protein CY35_15G086200 [Sphagnum magellanicum]|nr:hypothetical protein CY35_15G086200 [Sphagnum magellanicum]